jgi:hypothetical protein
MRSDCVENTPDFLRAGESREQAPERENCNLGFKKIAFMAAIT